MISGGVDSVTTAYYIKYWLRAPRKLPLEGMRIVPSDLNRFLSIANFRIRAAAVIVSLTGCRPSGHDPSVFR